MHQFVIATQNAAIQRTFARLKKPSLVVNRGFHSESVHASQFQLCKLYPISLRPQVNIEELWFIDERIKYIGVLAMCVLGCGGTQLVQVP
jgi:hypothetical protein